MSAMEDHLDEDDFIIFPLLDIENNNEPMNMAVDNNSGSDGEGDGEKTLTFKPLMTLRQRRHSRLLGRPIPNLNLQKIPEVLRAPPPKIQPQISTAGMPRWKANWKRALHKIRSLKDPWEKFHIDELPTETVLRHRYSPLKKKWVKDEVQVKMQKDPFNHGAMRACFRLKKLSSFSKSHDWKSAMNYVAKSYMEDVERSVYFEDVKLQMDAKLWGEEYNRHNPPKKVDVFQMCVVEFIDQPNRPLYHLEHFIEGEYIKYNSNSGFVEENLRFTPQAFSHFTFERSGHEMIVVDIQGVGDLWTDPQIHTAEGKDYGDGNLGTRGMALFFHSHICNSICESLGLSKFDMAPSETIEIKKKRSSKKMTSMTVVRGCEEMVMSPSPIERFDMHAFLMRSRSRTTSTCSGVSSVDDDDMGSPRLDSEEMSMSPVPMSPETPSSPLYRPQRQRFMSSGSEESSQGTLTDQHSSSPEDTLSTEDERRQFQASVQQRHRPSCINHEINLMHLESLPLGDSILGQIHHDMCKYHELGRFSQNDTDLDYDAAIYHETQAAELGILEAILTMARLYLGMQREILYNCTIEDSISNQTKGINYMEMAAEAGDRSAMLYMANAYETGLGLGNEKSRSFDYAVKWYTKAVETTQTDESGEFDATMDNPIYQLKAKMAELYHHGGFDLDPDPSYAGELYTEAADSAMEAMKGRLANKYYALAEEAWAACEEDE